jgi:hypothetical protein
MRLPQMLANYWPSGKLIETRVSLSGGLNFTSDHFLSLSDFLETLKHISTIEERCGRFSSKLAVTQDGSWLLHSAYLCEITIITPAVVSGNTAGLSVDLKIEQQRCFAFDSASQRAGSTVATLQSVSKDVVGSSVNDAPLTKAQKKNAKRKTATAKSKTSSPTNHVDVTHLVSLPQKYAESADGHLRFVCDEQGGWKAQTQTDKIVNQASPMSLVTSQCSFVRHPWTVGMLQQALESCNRCWQHDASIIGGIHCLI